MTMNPESRKRAVEVMAREQAKNSEFGGMSDEPEFWVHDCERMLDALLAAGFHVAEWRKVEEAEEGKSYLLHDKCGEKCIGAYFGECSEFVGDDSDYRDPTAIMDLPQNGQAASQQCR